MKYAVGETYERPTPFLVEDRDLFEVDEEGFATRTIKSWRPGVRNVNVLPDDVEMQWDGMGEEIRRIVAVARLEDGGVRILYRRAWRRPDGGTFGKNTVRMTTPSGFSAWRNGSNSGVAQEITRREQRAEMEKQLIES
ncbi:MAG: hypothetical protein ACR2QC_04435 [Gammaproteobacteria bacterium]